MCRIIIAFVIVAAVIASVLHVSAGWGLGITAVLVVIAGIGCARNPNRAQRTGKPA